MSDGAHSASRQGPHPLAARMAAELADRRPAARIVLLGTGDGRNLPVLEAAGVLVEGLAADADLPAAGESYDGVLSTHALLHGTRASVARRVRALSSLLAPAGLLCATFGSNADPRCGEGTHVDGDGWVADGGAEAGVVHAYFDREALNATLRDFDVVSADERNVREIVGRWAHDPSDHKGMVHWFVIAHAKLR
jgi:hypothetical protein